MEQPLLSVKGRNGQLELFQDRIRITRSGLVALISQGLKGEKEIYYSEISAIQFKRPGITVGYIQLTFTGGMESRKGLFQAVSDENTVTFTQDHLKGFEILKAELERRIHSEKKPQTSTFSNLHELDKLAELKEKGVVTEAEFQAAKKQLLNQTVDETLPLEAQQALAQHRIEQAKQVGCGAAIGMTLLIALVIGALLKVLHSYPPFLIWGLVLFFAAMPSLITKRYDFLLKTKNMTWFLLLLLMGLTWMDSLTPAHKAMEAQKAIEEQAEHKRKLQDLRLVLPKHETSSGQLDANNFQQVHSGMTYRQVTQLLGPGELTGELTLSGMVTKSYTWKRWNGANALITFQNGRVVSKAQAGL